MPDDYDVNAETATFGDIQFLMWVALSCAAAVVIAVLIVYVSLDNHLSRIEDRLPETTTTVRHG